MTLSKYITNPYPNIKIVLTDKMTLYTCDIDALTTDLTGELGGTLVSIPNWKKKVSLGHTNFSFFLPLSLEIV